MLDVADESIRTLNELFLGRPEGIARNRQAPSAAQLRSAALLTQAAVDLGAPPEGLDGQGALCELLARHS